MNSNQQKQLENAYFELWASTENGFDSDEFFKLREKYREIRTMIEEENQTVVRGTNDQEYQLYLDHANNGKGGDITNNHRRLKTYDEWLNS